MTDRPDTIIAALAVAAAGTRSSNERSHPLREVPNHFITPPGTRGYANLSVASGTGMPTLLVRAALE